MRWQLTLQLTAGLAALFGVGFIAIEHYVGPPSQTLIERAAGAEASIAASDAAAQWQRMTRTELRLVRAAADTPTLATLGSAFSPGEPRQAALKAAMDAVVDEIGTEGQAVLTSKEGRVIAWSGEHASQLVQSTAMKDAMSGAPTIRFEVIDGAGKMIAATPIGGVNGQGILLVSSALDSQRLNRWMGSLPMGTKLVLTAGKDIIGATFNAKKPSDFTSPDLGSTLKIDGDTYAISVREVSDDAGAIVRVIGAAPFDVGLLKSIEGRVQFMLVAFAAFAILLVVAVMMLSPIRSTLSPEDVMLEGDDALPHTDNRDIEPMPMGHAAAESAFFEDGSKTAPRMIQSQLPQAPSAPFVLPQAKDASPPRVYKSQPPLAAPSIPSMSAYDRRRADPPPAARTPSLSSDSIEGIPLPPRTGSMEMSSMSSPFDQIAQAALSSPPPSMPQAQTMSAPEVDPDTDLPMPVEHLQLPGLRPGAAGYPVAPPSSPYTSRTRTAEVSRPGATDDPWRNPSAPQRPMASTSQSFPAPRANVPPEELPRRLPSGPPMASSRPYTGNGSSQLTSSQPNREPVAFDEEHYRVVYNEFVGSKARLGESVDNITYEGFSSKLRSSEKELIDRHGCKAVRFQVLVKDRQVSLRPQLVR
jgi:hypothetical protein